LKSTLVGLEPDVIGTPADGIGKVALKVTACLTTVTVVVPVVATHVPDVTAQVPEVAFPVPAVHVDNIVPLGVEPAAHEGLQVLTPAVLPVPATQVPAAPLVGNAVEQSQMLLVARHEPPYVPPNDIVPFAAVLFAVQLAVNVPT
jgi:hypothetical protein